MRILNAADVRIALPMTQAIAAMRHAYATSSRGQAQAPPRIHIELPQKQGVCLFMPAFVPASADGKFGAGLTVKAVSVFPGNPARGLATIQGAVLVLDPDTGNCLALLDGAALTAIRTGAGSGVATDLLARPEAATLALFGAGTQAETQFEAVCLVRAIETVWIFTRTPQRAHALQAKWAGAEEAGRFPRDIRIVDTPGEAIRHADILCTTTTSQAALFEDKDLKPGAHINAIGAFRPDMQEIPAETVCRARVFVDNRESALREAGDLIQAMQSKMFDSAALCGEIGEVCNRQIEGRRHPSDITLFKSVGMAAQDAVAASCVLARAETEDIGQRVRWTT